MTVQKIILSAINSDISNCNYNVNINKQRISDIGNGKEFLIWVI